VYRRLVRIAETIGLRPRHFRGRGLHFDSLSDLCGALRAEKLRAHGIQVNSGSAAKDPITHSSSPPRLLIGTATHRVEIGRNDHFNFFLGHACFDFLVKKFFRRDEK